MPVIIARKSGSCSVCRGRIRVGEEIEFTRAEGAKHIECARAPAIQRLNTKPGRCEKCGRLLAPGEGHLALAEEHPSGDGSYVRRWSVRCVSGCPAIS